MARVSSARRSRKHSPSLSPRGRSSPTASAGFARSSPLRAITSGGRAACVCQVPADGRSSNASASMETLQRKPSGWKKLPSLSFAATASSSCGCWRARRHGFPNGVISCVSIASSRRAARSGADASSRASRASSSRCPGPWLALRAVRRRAPDERFVSISGADPLNFAGILTPGPKLAALAGNRVLYRDGIPIAFLEGDNARFLEPVEPEIENLARLALHGHAEPAAHLPRLRRLAQLEAARTLADRRARPAGWWSRASDSKTASR